MNFKKKYEIVIIGGGVAGAAAAVAAARRGKKVALIEKSILLGGLATSGLINVYLPLCDGFGRQVIKGIAEEFLKISIKYGPGDIPENWRSRESKDRFRCCFSPAAFAIALDEIVADAGVDIWLDTLFVQANVDEKNRLKSVEVENESGRGEILASCFIDASGGCAVARNLGISCFYGKNYLALWALEYQANSPLGYNSLSQDINMYIGSFGPRKDFSYDGKSVSSFILEGRAHLREFYLAQNSRHNHFALTLPSMPQFRTIACINARETLKSGQNIKHFEDSIGLAPDWRKTGHVWEIPYNTLIPESKVKGLLATGRCISAIDDAWEVTRVIPVAAMTGEVAGIAAAIAVNSGKTPDLVPYDTIREELKKSCFEFEY